MGATQQRLFCASRNTFGRTKFIRRVFDTRHNSTWTYSCIAIYYTQSIRKNDYFHRNHYFSNSRHCEGKRTHTLDTIHVSDFFLFNLIAFRDTEDKLSRCRWFLSSSFSIQKYACTCGDGSDVHTCMGACHGRFLLLRWLRQQKNQTDNSMHAERWVSQVNRKQVYGRMELIECVFKWLFGRIGWQMCDISRVFG